MIKILAVTLLLLFSFCLNAEESLPQLLSADVPQDILWLIQENPSQNEIIKRIGKPSLAESNKHYYALNNYKYSLEIEYAKSKKVLNISYKIREAKLKMNDFASVLNPKEFHLFPKEGHTRGRYIAVLAPSFGIRLIFKNNSKKRLFKIQYKNEWRNKQ